MHSNGIPGYSDLIIVHDRVGIRNPLWVNYVDRGVLPRARQPAIFILAEDDDVVGVKPSW